MTQLVNYKRYGCDNCKWHKYTKYEGSLCELTKKRKRNKVELFSTCDFQEMVTLRIKNCCDCPYFSKSLDEFYCYHNWNGIKRRSKDLKATGINFTCTFPEDPNSVNFVLSKE